jgi:NAD(P)H-flavin reductase
MNLLETIKQHDAKMEATQKEVELLSQALMLLVDNLIDRDLTLCVEPGYMKHAYQILKDRGLMDYARNERYEQVQQGLCDTSVRLKKVNKTITGTE